MKLYVKVSETKFGRNETLVTENGDEVDNVMILQCLSDKSSNGLEENRAIVEFSIKKEFFIFDKK